MFARDGVALEWQGFVEALLCLSVSMISLEFSVHFSPLLGVTQVGSQL